MEEKLVSIKTAKLAKEKGFNLFCRTAYTNPDDRTGTSLCYDEDGYDWETYIIAPTKALLQKWLMEEYDIWVLPTRHHPYPNNSWKCLIEYQRENVLHKGEKYEITLEIFPKIYKGVEEPGTYEDAFEAGLQEGVKLINIGNI